MNPLSLQPKELKIMDFTVFSAKEFTAKLKVTIQETGKLGFTRDTADFLKLELRKYAKFAKDNEKGNLYLIILDKGNTDAFEIKGVSGYYYVQTARLFDKLGMDYKNMVYMFDLIRQESLDNNLQGEVYLMKERHHKRKEKEKGKENEDLEG